MRKLYVYLGVFLLFLVSSADSKVYACRAPQPSAQTLVSKADLILRATAVKYTREPQGDIRTLGTPTDTEIEFKVEEVIKGEKAPSVLNLYGYLTDKDDYNDVPIPYNFVRPNGRGGSCSAYEYKKGAEFLLFLKGSNGEFTTNWYALAPTNEQLHPKDDKWLAWVKNHVKTIEEKTQ